LAPRCPLQEIGQVGQVIQVARVRHIGKIVAVTYEVLLAIRLNVVPIGIESAREILIVLRLNHNSLLVR
jgi:hypothetical protein